MTEPGRIPDEFDPFASRTQRRRARFDRRREKIVEEIQRNRRGEYKVPTWVLVAALLALIAFWVAVALFR
jgi:hypothetical protein